LRGFAIADEKIPIHGKIMFRIINLHSGKLKVKFNQFPQQFLAQTLAVIFMKTTKKQIFTLIFLLIFCFGKSQDNWNYLKIDSLISDTLFSKNDFVLNPFMIEDENGSISSGLPKIDTNKYLIESNCIVDSNEFHKIRFVECERNKDTIIITIQEENPAYYDEIIIRIKDEKFKSEYKTAYKVYFPGQEYQWINRKQELILNSNDLDKISLINGWIDLEFLEIFELPKQKVKEKSIKINGYFKCNIE